MASIEDGKENDPERRKKCLIHYDCEECSAPLILPQIVQSWKTLVQAAKIRKHTLLLDIASNSETDAVPPNVWYHPKCRKLFTMKRDLDMILNTDVHESQSAKRDLDMISNTEEHDSQSTKMQQDPTANQIKSSGKREHDEVCLFCERKRKYLKSNNKDKFHKDTNLNVDQKLRETACKNNDAHILAATNI